MRRIAIAAIALPVLVAGCGGDSSPKETRLTQTQFVREGNGVCIRSDRRVYRIGDLSSNPGPWRETADAAEKGIEEMLELRPPAAKQKQFDSMITSARQLQRAVEDIYKALVADQPGKARAAQRRAVKADSVIKRKAHTLGLTFCEQLLTNWPA